MHGVNEPRVQQWIDALRSGEFEQTQEHLRDIDDTGAKSYCCLGVAQEVALATGYKVPRTGGLFPAGLYWGADGMNDAMAKEWFGFTSGDPVLVEGNDADAFEPITCVRANDNLGWSFERIADALEARYITPKVADGSATG